MPSSSPRPAWWRLPTPSCLVLVFILCFLPWIEVGCESKIDMSKQFGGQGGANVSFPGVQGGKQVIMTQTGVQIAYGGHTNASILSDLPEGGAGAGGGISISGQAKKDIAAAPLMFVFFLAVVVAIATGFALAPGRLRLAVVGLFTGAAIVVLLLQALVLGFPLANEVAKEIKNPATNQAGMLGDNAVTLFVRYTPSYWISWVVLVGALIPLVLEELLASKKRLPEAVPVE
jgi:hypothetical protein